MASHSSIGDAAFVASFVVGGVPLGMLLLLGLGCSGLGSGTSHHIQHSRHQPYPSGWTAASAPCAGYLTTQQPLHHPGRRRQLGERLRARGMADTTLLTIQAAKMLRLEEMITR